MNDDEESDRGIVMSACLSPPFIFSFCPSWLMAGQLGRYGPVGSVLGPGNVPFRICLSVACRFLAGFLFAFAGLFASLSPSRQPIWLAWTICGLFEGLFL